ncbi:protein PSK SIMULATOR 1-like [Aristolochia californica]|uniref:protein PSK SIMULATOR 1-like n=1 Tax=Aristolochia californica TaxID=171875 RepID=UPI0035DD6F65
MALESWLLKVKTAVSNGIVTVRTTAAKESKKANVGVLAFEIAGLMSKLLLLWQALSDKSVLWIRHEAIALEGVRKIVSNDESFLLALACAEISESLRHVANSVGRIGKRCEDSALRSFDRFFEEFADFGKDAQCWVLTRKDMDSKVVKKMNRYVATAARLHKEINEMGDTEQSLTKLLGSTDLESPIRVKKISDLQQKLFWQRQEVKQLKEKSLWNQSFDPVVLLLARSVFTVLARLKLVFGIGHGHENPVTLPRSLSATVYPSENSTPSSKFVSGPLITKNAELPDLSDGFFNSNTKLLKPPTTTLGSAAVAQHYANLIIVIEKMIRSPHLIGMDARDDLYGMLPASLRASLRTRLRGVGPCASDPALAAEWREALARILDWLAPLAHNMIKWQSERSFEQQSVVRRSTTVLLLQTLFFANQAKAEAAVTELLVGLNYIWRFEREMNAKALIACTEFNGLLNTQS